MSTTRSVRGRFASVFVHLLSAAAALLLAGHTQAAPSDPWEGGQWGPVIAWPHIAVSAANLPDGRILTWSGSERETWPTTEQTYSATWNPATGEFIGVFHEGHNMFCAHLAMMEDGRVFVNGGRNQTNSPWTSLFDYRGDKWVQIENMASGGRWYPTTLALADGDIFTAIGTATLQQYPETWDPDNGWQIKNGIDFNTMVLDDYYNSGTHGESRWWPLLHLAPNGQIFHSGPTPKMHWIDPAGNGSFSQVGDEFTDWYHKHGTTVMYDEGKLLTAGGWLAGNNGTSTNRAFTVDLNGPAPVVQATASMTHARKFQNGVILPNGEVLVIGGNTSGQKFSDNGAILDTEIWNPNTGQWRLGAAMVTPRNYHSIALLLVDGRVLAAGSGYCSNSVTCNNASHRDGEVYSPPYLFTNTGQAAPRPAITGAPGRIASAQSFNVSATPGMARFTMIKMSSTTHGMNSDVRFLEVPFTETSAGNYSLDAHPNQNVLTAGYWMLFALDANGVPSVAHVVQANTSGLPWVANIPEQSAVVGGSVSLQVEASDADNDPLTYSATGLPPGLSIDAVSGLISGTPTTEGQFTVTVTVSDNDEGNRQKTFDFIIFGQGLGSIVREWWTGISGTDIASLTGSANYPDNPTGSELVNSFEGPTNVLDNYGSRIYGFLNPTETGSYVFWIASDDNGELWLSTGEDPANRALIASVPSWSSSRQWDKFPEQQSAPVTLQAGQRYYIEALMKEGGGGDNLAVAWQRPGTSGPVVIDGAYLSPYGTEVLPEARFEIGTLDNVGSDWQTVTLDQTYNDMVVIATPRNESSDLPAVTRVRNASGNSFEVRVQNPSDTPLAGYSVHYVVTETGRYDNAGLPMEAVKYTSTVTGSRSAWVDEARSYLNSYTNPVVIGQVMSANDSDWSAFWASDGSRTNPPSAASLHVGKEVAEDTDTTRANETVAYIVMEAGSGTLGDIDYQAALGSDTIVGVGDGVRSYDLGLQANVAVLASAAMDGNNGGWPVLLGADPLAGGAVALAVDEDQIADTERNHTTEQVAFLALAGEVAVTPVVDPVVSVPAVSGSNVNYTISSNVDYLLYKWSFGDGTPETVYTDSLTISHSYASPGRYVVVLTILNPNTGEETSQTFTQLIHAPLTANLPTASSTIAVHEGQGQVWNVNPDNDTVSVIDTTGLTRIAEIAVGDQPNAIAVAPNGSVWAVNKGDATISVLDASTLVVIDTLTLPAGSLPHGLAFSPTANEAYVALEGTGELLRLSTVDGAQLDSQYLGPHPRHVSVSADGTRVLVARFVTPPLPGEATSAPVVEAGGVYYGGQVQELDAATLTPLTTMVLRHSDRGVSEHTGPGVPNYLGPAVISPDGLAAWVPSKQDNILAGALRGGQGMTFDQTVRAITSKLDLVAGAEAFPARIDHDNASVGSHAAFGPYGAYLFTTLEGNREVVISDAYSATELLRFDVGRAPQGVAISADGSTLYVHNFMDRSVSIVDVSAVTGSNDLTVAPLATVATVQNEALSGQVFLGKQLFYDARDPRLAGDSYMSCASCHNDGGEDGRVWDFTGVGEGLRNTITLEGRGGMAHGFVHWSANFDEIQDFEAQIRNFAGGTGLMNDADFNTGTRSEPLGDPKTGLSGDLDALAAYVESLNEHRDSPYRNADGTLSATAELGRQVFEAKDCGSCHSRPRFTDSAAVTLHDVGTMTSASGQRLGGPLAGIDTPSLISVWRSPPYLHDGSAMDLTEAVEAHSGLSVTATELNQLGAYLDELDAVTALIGEEPPAAPAVQMGTETREQPDGNTWLAVTFVEPFTVTPIVVMGPPSFNGGNPTTVRVRNVTTTGFEYQIDEWDYLDGYHLAETLAWIAAEPGSHDFGGLQVEAGAITSTDSFAGHSFAIGFGAAPVLFSQVVTTNEASAVTTRQRNVTGSGFELQLEEEEAGGAHAAETVHYLAIETGSGSVNGQPLAVGITPDAVRHTAYTIAFGASFTAPALYANMQSTDGGDSAVLRHNAMSATQVNVFVEEEASANTEINHTTETVGWMVIGQ